MGLPGGIERSDMGRYCALHRFGGVYADLDYEVRTNFFHELPSDKVSLIECRSKDQGIEVEIALMASAKGHWIWRMAMQQTFTGKGDHRWDNSEGGTGPRMLSSLLSREVTVQGI